MVCKGVKDTSCEEGRGKKGGRGKECVPGERRQAKGRGECDWECMKGLGKGRERDGVCAGGGEERKGKGRVSLWEGGRGEKREGTGNKSSLVG